MNELSVNKSLGSPGWYRFAKRKVPNEVSAKYALGEVLSIKMVRAFNNAENESYDISCALSYNKYSYKILNSSIKSKLITKIREVYYPDDGLCYLEIYYNGTSGNDVKISLKSARNHYEAVNFESSVGTPTEILNFNIESIQTDLKWISKNNSGLLAGLVMPNTIWLIVGVHLKQKEVVAGIAYKPDESTNTVFTTIYSTENMHISTNNQGTVAIQYQNTSTGISSFALQLV